MKNLKITIVNNNSTFEKTLNVDTEKLDLNTAFATTMQPFFKLITMQSNKQVDLFKMNKPFDFKIEFEDRIFDTSTIETCLKTKFKLNKTAKSKRRFAKNVFDVMNWSIEDYAVISQDELLTQLQD